MTQGFSAEDLADVECPARMTRSSMAMRRCKGVPTESSAPATEEAPHRGSSPIDQKPPQALLE